MDKQTAPPQQSADTPATSNNTDGDHDSGVDENTQKKDVPTTNGDLGSPSKSPSKIPAPKKLSMSSPTKSNKALPKTPEAPPTAEKKKVPMNKIQVGAAPSPNLKIVKSKIGSLQNTTHKPGGGNVKIENRKLDWKAQPRIAAKNDTYQPGGGDKKITQVKLQWNAKPKVGSLENATHKPGGGEKKIESVKLDFKDKAKPKVGSKDNIKHTPGGGNVKTLLDGSQENHSGDIENQKIDIKPQSKIGSMDNVKYKPGGGDKKIFDDKEYLRQMSGATSKAGSEGIPSGTQGENGWSSANTSRRTSRDRRSSHDRRYRSESRLATRTPELRVSPKEEHCSLRERHLQEQDILQEAPEQKDIINREADHQELVSPLRPTSPASEQTMTRDSSEDKDLNSNQTNSSHSDCPEYKRDGEQNNKTLVVDPAPLQHHEVPKPEPKNAELNVTEKHIINSNGTYKDELSNDKPKVPNKVKDQEIEMQKELETSKVNELTKEAENKACNLKNPQETGSQENGTTNNQNSQTISPENENVLKPESKESMVKEVKEVDSKEMAAFKNKRPEDKTALQLHQFDVNMVNTLEVTSVESANDKQNAGYPIK